MWNRSDSRSRKAWPAGLLLLVVGLTTGNLRAQNSTLRLRWGPVAGATGYRIQVRDADEKTIIDERVQANDFRADLNPGEYEYRLSALDAFEKPTDWTRWFRVLVRKTGTPVLDGTPPDPVFTEESSFPFFISGRNLFPYTKVRIVSSDGSHEVKVVKSSLTRDKGLELELDTVDVPEGRYDLILLNPGGKALRKQGYVLLEDKGIASLPYENVVPGLPQILRGNVLRGTLWMTAFAGLAAGGAVEWSAAESLVNAKESSAIFQSFNNPVWYLAYARDRFRGTNTGGVLASITYINGVQQTQEYEVHQRNQATLGGAALLLYAGHWLDVLFFQPATVLNEGSQFSIGFYLHPDTNHSNVPVAGFRMTFGF